MEKFDFMGELLKILLEAVRKQAFSVILLLSACGGLIWFSLDQREGLRAAIVATETKCREDLAAMSARLDLCEEQRNRLTVEVAVLRVEVNALSARRR